MEITKILEADVGHRLQGHESKCRNAHGHRYVFEITCSAPKLDAVGRVVDFSVIKKDVGGWIDEYWDHGFILEEGDRMIEFLNGQKNKVFILDAPPTAENLATYLFSVASAQMKQHGITVVRVRCRETPTCYADATEGL